MKLLIVSATDAEIQPLREQLTSDFEQVQENVFIKKHLSVHLLVTGVGMLLTSVSMLQYLEKQSFDWVINAGIAGAFNDDLNIGDVVEVVSERFGDLGVQERDGNFKDVFEMKLLPQDEFPFEKGVMNIHKNPNVILDLKEVKGLTVNKVHGKAEDIFFIKNKYNADIETMEGAAFFYVCLLKKIPFTEIRAISNRVEPRNRANWDIPLSVRNLNTTIYHIISEKK